MRGFLPSACFALVFGLLVDSAVGAESRAGFGLEERGGGFVGGAMMDGGGWGGRGLFGGALEGGGLVGVFPAWPPLRTVSVSAALLWTRDDACGGGRFETAARLVFRSPCTLVGVPQAEGVIG